VPCRGDISCVISFFLLILRPTRSTLFPYTTLFRSDAEKALNRPAILLQVGLENLWFFVVGERNCPEMLPHPASTQRHNAGGEGIDRKSTRLNSSHLVISYAVFCLTKKIKTLAIACG